MRIILLLLFSWTALQLIAQDCEVKVTGVVLDFETKEPIPFVTVLSSEKGKGAVTDLQGQFTIEHLCDSEVELIISHLGYKKTTHHHDAYHDEPVIYLAADDQLLESVVVEGEYYPSAIKTITVDQIDQADISSQQSTNFGELVGSISGVSTISTGQNIVKPIIHGLHSNRVLIINNGVRHEFQNWGVEHAPEIDPSSANSIKVVKGAATVRYGPDALGGVLLIDPQKPELSSHLHGELKSNAATNGRAYGGQLLLQKGWDQLAIGVNGSYQRQGDLHAPQYQLTNTGKEEYSFSIFGKYHFRNFDLEGYYSHFSQSLGILRGSVSGNLDDFKLALDRTIPANTQPFSYQIDNPKQVVTHDLLKLKASWVFDHQDLEIQYAYQKNNRQEFDVRRSSLASFPIINLGLGTHSLDLVWNREGSVVESSYGLQTTYRDNNVLPGTRTTPFLPNYNGVSLGLFSLQSLEIDKSILELGLRYNFEYQNIRGIDQYENNYADQLQFSQLTGSFGFMVPINRTMTYNSNLGMGWRIPNIWELYSFGKHGVNIEYGLWRYRQTDGGIESANVLNQSEKRVNPETGLKWIHTLSSDKSNTSWELTGYANYIFNYLYAKPAGVTSTVNGVYPYFIYDQTNAFIAGADITYRHTIQEKVEGEHQISYVFAKDVLNSDNFVEIPPLMMSTKWSYQSNWKAIGFPEFFAKGTYRCQYWQQPRTIAPDSFRLGSSDELANEGNFDLMDAPPGYFLADMGVQSSFRKVQVLFRVNNVLNTSYRMNTDRLRYFSDQIGRNFKVTVKYQFQ